MKHYDWIESLSGAEDPSKFVVGSLESSEHKVYVLRVSEH